jgi:hypothetical protein
MVTGAIFGLTLVVAASVEPNVSVGPNISDTQLSPRQKSAVMQPLLRTATDCIIHAVTANPRLQVSIAAGNVNDLIVASMSACVEPVHAMIDAHDRLFGDGSGEAFFMGPYLDALPAAVTKQVRGGRQ